MALSPRSYILLRFKCSSCSSSLRRKATANSATSSSPKLRPSAANDKVPGNSTHSSHAK
jgi:hypothetical protein